MGIFASLPYAFPSCKAFSNPSFPFTYIGLTNTGSTVLTLLDTFVGITIVLFVMGSRTS